MSGLAPQAGQGSPVAPPCVAVGNRVEVFFGPAQSTRERLVRTARNTRGQISMNFAYSNCLSIRKTEAKEPPETAAQVFVERVCH